MSILSTFPASYLNGQSVKDINTLVLKKQQVSFSSTVTPIDIILLTYNRLEYFIRTISALVQNTRYPYRLIIVDNNSSPEMRSYLIETAVLYDHLILNDENYHTVAFQRGISCAKSDPYIVSDPDILVPAFEGPCWLERLIGLHKDYPEMGLIALNLDPANKPAKLLDVYIGEKTPYGGEITLGNVGTVMQSIKRRFFDGCYITDWETCQQIRDNGGKVGFANRIVAWHLGWDEDRDYPEYLVEKHGYFKQKYGSETYLMYTENNGLLSMMNNVPTETGYYDCARPEVQLLVNPASRRILDVGCAAGVLGYELKLKLSAEVWGVEYSPVIAEQAKGRLDRVFAGAIEDVLPKLPDSYFDTIVMADILEHLVQPLELLRAIKAKLAVGGEIVLSIPNVRHHSVIRQLLEGRWEYKDAGILDRTHLRFFTRFESLRLIEDAGYEIRRMEAIQLDGDPVIPIEVIGALSKAGLKVDTLAEESQHYQYLFVVSDAVKQSESTKANDQTVVAKAAKTGLASAQNMVSIIILTWNQLELTKQCVESILKHTDLPYEIIFVDNGSSDGTAQWLTGLAQNDNRLSVILNDSNLGFAAGCNQGLMAAKGDTLVLLNNDTVVTPGWLSGLVEVLERNPDAGVVGPMTNSASGLQVLADPGYGTLDELPRWAEAFRKKNRHRIIPQRRVVGFCHCFSKRLIERIGLLDDSFGSGNYEDDDFCLRAELAGFRNIVVGDLFIHHEGGATFLANNMDRGNENRKNRAIFKRKWDPATLDEAVLRRWLALNAIEEADLLARRGASDAAVKKLLDDGIRNDQSWPAPYLKLAEILLASGRFEDALEVLPEVPPETDQAILNEIAAICYASLGEDEKAEKLANDLLLAGVDSARPLEVLGMLAARRGHFDDAMGLFKRTYYADPQRGEALLSMGILSWDSGDLAGAYQLLCRSVILSPINRNALQLLHEASVRLGLVKDFIGLLKETLTIFPDARDVILALSDALADENDLLQAISWLEKGMALIGCDDILLDAALKLREQLGPHDFALLDAVPQASLCMIVKDEAVNLPRCLASAKAVFADIVVVDTGSSDRTVDVAVAFGARVFNFLWNGDFSSARNFSKAKAKSPWIFLLDADELLSELDYPLIAQTLRESADNQVAWSVTTRNYTNRVESEGWHANDGGYPLQEQGDGWYPSRKVRLFPASERINFRGEIHEMVEADLKSCGVPIRQAEFVVHHYGELADADRRVKQLRYYEMGKRKLAEHPGDAAARVELAIQAGELHIYNEALEQWDYLLKSGHLTRDVYFNRGYVLMGLNRFHEASEMASNVLKMDPDHKESKYNWGVCLLNTARPELALDMVKASFAAHSNYPLLKALLCVLYLCTGEVESAMLIFEELKSCEYAIERYIYDRLAVLRQLGHQSLYERVKQSAAEIGVVKNNLLGENNELQG